MQFTALNCSDWQNSFNVTLASPPASRPALSVHGDGKSLSLSSHQSCGHGDWWNVKVSVCPYVSHYSDIRLITSGFGAIAESRDFIECKIQALIWRYWVTGKASASAAIRAVDMATGGMWRSVSVHTSAIIATSGYLLPASAQSPNVVIP